MFYLCKVSFATTGLYLGLILSIIIFSIPLTSNAQEFTETQLLKQMIIIASEQGGIGRESELIELKNQIEAFPKPEHLNRKAARKANDQGLEAFSLGQYEQAKQFWIAANQADPADVEIINNLGQAYLKLGEHQNALKAFADALKISPARSGAWANLAEYFAQQDKLQQAVSCYALTFFFSKNQEKTQKFLAEKASSADDFKIRQAAQLALQLDPIQIYTNSLANALDDDSLEFETSIAPESTPVTATAVSDFVDRNNVQSANSASDLPRTRSDFNLIVEGKIVGHACGDSCYLTIIDFSGKLYTGLCEAVECASWNSRGMPDSLQEQQVKVFVRKANQYDRDMNIAGELVSFEKIYFITPTNTNLPVTETASIPQSVTTPTTIRQTQPARSDSETHGLADANATQWKALWQNVSFEEAIKIVQNKLSDISVFIDIKYQEMQSNADFESLSKTAIVVAIIISLWGIYLGLTYKAVFYMDSSDLFVSFSGWIVLLVSLIAGMLLDLKWPIYFGIASAILIAIYSMYLAFAYNKHSFLVAIPVGFAKFILGMLYVLAWVQAISPGGRTAADRSHNRKTAFIAIGLLTPLFYRLVNGLEVYQRKGWALPNDLIE